MPHEAVYLTEQQTADIANLRIAISDLESSGQPAVVISVGRDALEEEIGEIEASAPAGAPKAKCVTCNPHTHCATCGNPIGDDGNTTVEGGIAYMPEEPDSDA